MEDYLDGSTSVTSIAHEYLDSLPMVLLTSVLTFAVSTLLYVQDAVSTAINMTSCDRSLSNEAREILSRATPAPPHWVIYWDRWSGAIGPPDVSAISGFNVFTLSFLLTEGAYDQARISFGSISSERDLIIAFQAYEWTTLTDAQRATIKSQYAAAGIKLIVSVFGATDVPTSTGADPIATANTFAAWVKQYSLDGVDVDYEDFNAFDGGKAEAWLISFTTQLRAQLPSGTYIITHAPVAPWFSPSMWPGGGYLEVDSSVGKLIDWYNVQFYNPNGVPLSKLVIGKPATASDANNGFMSTSTLASCLKTAKAQGWNGGVMVWQYPDATASWITAVRSSSWPV
ncbi:hypothetical protein C0995_009535 [Termitomyces sp. Mi166|nr:hypothetical protein C0995_009535 [Termitomyces sp. Mi166\